MKRCIQARVRQFLILVWVLIPAIGIAGGTEALRRHVEALGVAGYDQYGIDNTADIIALYAGNRNQFLWFKNGPLSSKRNDLLEEIKTSGNHGFELSRYHYEFLTRQALPEEVLEVLYSDAFLSQIRHRAGGVLSEQEHEWLIKKPGIDALGLMRTTVTGKGDIRHKLQTLWPLHTEYQSLIAKRAELTQQDEQITEIIPPGPLLREGDVGPRVEQLQDRLLGPGDHPAVFDQQLTLTVKQLQRNAALEADGIVGEATLELLNSNRFSWIDRIDANLERWRWLPRQLPSAYIRVNVAAFRLRAIDNNRPELTMDVIVGRPYRQTPIFTEAMKYLVFFPFWNVPTSIATKDKLPLLRTNSEPLALMGYEAKMAGSDEFVSVQTIEWRKIKPGSFLLRQRPGDQNALGKVKFMLPNIHDVYLHDTPDKALFNKTERLFSSGCIRVSDATALVEWLAQGDRSLLDADLAELLKSGTTTTQYLAKPMPVYLVYLTAFVDDGSVVFRRDVYRRDQRIIDELRRKEVGL